MYNIASVGLTTLRTVCVAFCTVAVASSLPQRKTVAAAKQQPMLLPGTVMEAQTLLAYGGCRTLGWMVASWSSLSASTKRQSREYSGCCVRRATIKHWSRDGSVRIFIHVHLCAQTYARICRGALFGLLRAYQLECHGFCDSLQHQVPDALVVFNLAIGEKAAAGAVHF